MRIGLIIAGLILVIGGVLAWMGEFEYTKDKHVASVGSLTASVQTERTVPQWIGGVAALVGVGLIAAGAMRKS
jgi:hypothetical protein